MEFPHVLIADGGWRQSQRGEDGDPAFREHCQSENWQLPLVEIWVRA